MGRQLVRSLTLRGEPLKETALGIETNELPSWVENKDLLRAMKTVDIYGTAPTLYLTESDQTDPAGRWGHQLSSDVYSILRALTANWATNFKVLSFTNTGVMTGQVLDAVTNAVTTALTLNHNTTGTPANSLGLGIDFGIETSTTESTLAGRIQVWWSDIVHASRDSVMAFSAYTAGVVKEMIRIDPVNATVSFSNLNNLQLLTGTTVTLSGNGYDLTIQACAAAATTGASLLLGNQTGVNTGAFSVGTPNATYAAGLERMRITGGATTALVTWPNCQHDYLDAYKSAAYSFRATHVTATTNAGVSSATFRAISSGDMVSGFGSGIDFYVRDTAAVDNFVAAIVGLRLGADNTGGIAFYIPTAGANAEVFRIDNTGSMTIASAATIAGAGTGASGFVLKNPKNSANTTVSGTVKTVELDIGGVPYYFLVSPTSSA